MKTFKLITIAAAMLLGLESCSDEQKALDFVSKEVMPEEKIENELIQRLAKAWGNNFKTYFDDYFHIDYKSNGRYESRFFITISEEFRHEIPFWGNANVYELGVPPYGNTSEKIISTICSEGINYLDKTFESGNNLDSITATPLSGEQQMNRLASLAVETDYNQRKLDMFTDGVIQTKPVKVAYHYEWKPLNDEELQRARELDKKYEYEWTRMDEEKQREIIEDYAKWLIVVARDNVKQFNYKLVDKSSKTTGEDSYEVRYLLDPPLEIVFPVRKVGKTFVSDGYWIDGSILQDINSDI